MVAARACRSWALAVCLSVAGASHGAAYAQTPPPALPAAAQRVAVPEPASTRSVGSTAPSRPRVTMKIGGGASTVAVGDFKTVYDASNANARALYTVTGGQDVPPTTFNGGIDIIIHITRVIGIGTGVGYVWASRRSSREVSSSSWDQHLDSTLTVSALPVRVGPVISIPFSSGVEAYVSVMPAYYIGKVTRDWSYTYFFHTYSVTQTESLTGRKNGFGVEGALGIRFNMGSSFGMFLEANGRYARLANLNGTYASTSSSGASASRAGALTYYEYYSAADLWVPSVSLTSSPITTSPTVRNVRGASLDLSGGGMAAGLTIRF